MYQVLFDDINTYIILFQYPGKTCPSMHRDMHYKGMFSHFFF